MKIDKTGINLIHKFESCKLKSYKAHKSEKYYTIGWGHYGKDVKQGQTITKAKADELFNKDIKVFENGVNNLVKIKITQSMFNALVSFSYNVGLGALKNSSLLKYVNSKQFEKASNEFKKWNKCGGEVLKGLVRRREERKEFLRMGVNVEGVKQNVSRETLPDLKYYKGVSLVDALNGKKYKSDFKSREKYWKQCGFKETYKGTAKQNEKLLKELKK